jgi:hypothetical protein
LAASAGSLTGIAERSFTAATRLGRLGFAGRITSRWVKNLFDDPDLNQGSDLSVQGGEYAAGVSFQVLDLVRLGVMGFASSSQVLSSIGSGFGYRAGADVSLSWIRAGVVFGDTQAATDWQSLDGAGVRTEGTKRLSVGVGTPPLRVLGLEPAAALELNIDTGFDKGSWLRGNVSVAALHGVLRGVAGWAERATHATGSYRELGIIADVDRFQLQVGVRLGADPVPGNSLTVGIGAYNK